MEKSLRRIDLENGTVVGQEILLQELDERIRDVRVGPDGLIYVLTDSAEGKLLRLSPPARELAQRAGHQVTDRLANEVAAN